MSGWRVIRYDVKVGEVYDAYDVDRCGTRRCRVVKVVQDNSDDVTFPKVVLQPYVEVTIRYPDGMPDRVLRGPEIDYFLRRVAPAHEGDCRCETCKVHA